jgi:hypothetical protein
VAAPCLNAGSAPLVVSGVPTSGPNAADYLVSSGCQQPLAPGAGCQIAVRFAPQGQGASTATLTVLSNSASDPGPVTLSGTGGPPAPNGPGSGTGNAIKGKSTQGRFLVEQGRRGVVHGTLMLKRGATARHQLRLKPGSYRLLITTGSGRGVKTLLRLTFRVR